MKTLRFILMMVALALPARAAVTRVLFTGDSIVNGACSLNSNGTSYITFPGYLRDVLMTDSAKWDFGAANPYMSYGQSYYDMSIGGRKLVNGFGSITNDYWEGPSLQVNTALLNKNFTNALRVYRPAGGTNAVIVFDGLQNDRGTVTDWDVFRGAVSNFCTWARADGIKTIYVGPGINGDSGDTANRQAFNVWCRTNVGIIFDGFVDVETLSSGKSFFIHCDFRQAHNILARGEIIEAQQAFLGRHGLQFCLVHITVNSSLFTRSKTGFQLYSFSCRNNFTDRYHGVIAPNFGG